MLLKPTLSHAAHWLSRLRMARLLTILSLLVLSLLIIAVVRAQSEPNEQKLHNAWQLAQQAGRYRFTSQVKQTTLPAARRTNVGSTVKESHLTVQGEIDRRAQLLHLSLWDNLASAFDPKQALEVIIDKGESKGRVAGGEWQSLDALSDAFAPGGDGAIYLFAARHVTDLGSETRMLPKGEDSHSSTQLVTRHFHFALDGKVLAAYLAQQLEAELRKKGELPPGMVLNMGDSLRQIAGVGEAWLDSDGLPLRMQIEIEFPEQPNGERILVSVQTDFTAFDRTYLFLDGSGIANRLQATAYLLQDRIDWSQLLAVTTALLFLLAATLVLKRLPTGKANTVVSLAVLGAILSGQVAQAAPPAASASRSLLNATQRNEQKPPPDTQPAFDPQQNLLAASEQSATSQLGRYSNLRSATVDPVTSGPDADRDGLSDILETVWTTNANDADSDDDGLLDGEEVRRCPERTVPLVNNKLSGKNATWHGCSNPKDADTDDDGLTDNQEVVFLATSPNDKDSDGDGLNDSVEVLGYAGATRFSNALNPDTDGDGLLDGIECPNQTCADSDGDGELDIFDLDNDNDGFIGSFDSAPFTVLGKDAAFTQANPFQLSLNHLTANKSVFVDFQIRPSNANHIGFGQSVLDWPTGDSEGQIQRRLDTTFADANPLPASVAAPSIYPQSYGDMRLLPMLEIEMDGSRAPLPRTTAAQTVTFQSSPVLAVVQLIKQTEDVKLLGFTVSEPQALRIRVNKLSAEYSNYQFEIHKGGCSDALATPLYTASGLSSGGEKTFPGAVYAELADGAHVALLKASGLSPALCLPIPKAAEEASQTPLNFVLPVQTVGTVRLVQAGSAIQLSTNLPKRNGSHELLILAGSCQNRQAQVAALSANAVGSATLANRKLVDLADGKHILLIKQGTQTVACSSLGNVVNGAASESEMIDATAMGKLGITVSEEDAAGTLVAHIPLNIAQDQRSGVSSGFAGTMLYDSTAATNWQHRIRMSWWVQLLTDMCATPADDFMQGAPEQDRLKAACGTNANQLQLVHVYDENWQLAGLTVREEHNYDMDVIFEDPKNDRTPESDDYLWQLAKGLDEQFVTGVDCVRNNASDGCATNGQRDYNLATIYNTFHNGVNANVSALNRWGIEAGAFYVEKLDSQLNTFLDQGKVMQSYVPALLNSHFLNNGTPRSAAPVLLFASENSFRNVAMGDANYATTSANALTVDFAPANDDAQSVKTIAGLSWAPYRYAGAAQGWQSYPFEEYWDLLDVRLKSSRAFSAGEDEESRAIAAGKIRLAQTYFAYFYSGRAGLVQSDNDVVGRWDVNANDYISLAERAQYVLDSGDLIEVIAQGSLINQVIEPLAESIAENFSNYRFQQLLMREDATARLLDQVLLITDLSDNRSATNLWKNIAGDTRDALTESFFHNFRPSSLSRLGGRVTTGVAVGLAGTAILTGIAGGIYAAGRGDGIRVAQQVLNGVGLATEIAGAVGMMATVSKAAAELGEKVSRVVVSSLSEASQSARLAGVVALLVGELINYSLLIAQIAINHLPVGGLVANQLAAQSVAASLVAGMMFALATTGIGAIVVAIIGLIDGLIFLICGFLDEEQTESIPGQIFCQGISGWLTELVSFFIYAQNEITRINDPYRLNYLNFQPGLRNVSAGFTPGAPLDMALKVRNTLALAHLPVNIGILYAYQFNDESLQSARFAYSVLSTKPEEGSPQLHDSLTRGEGANPWLPLEKDAQGKIITVYDDTDVTSGDALQLAAVAGLNQPLPAFLAEGYAVPVQECVSNATFTLPLLPPIVVCWVRSRGETNYNDLNLKFDIFPATLDEFYALEPSGEAGRYRQRWANSSTLPFPPLLDADGDGLRYDADADDSHWDTDGDGLSDAVEQARNSNPANPDSDSDGLSDLREQLWGTNPDVADSDGDGLSDGEEVTGWSIGYGSNGGTLLKSWTFSDPLARDIDHDSIFDAKEKVYGFNPNLANDSTVLVYEAAVNEPTAPLLLTRFEEGNGATTFADSSQGSGSNIAACVNKSCPSAGMRGRFGNALAFNGTDQYLTIAANSDIGKLRTNLSLSAWVKPSKLSGLQSVIQIGPGGANGVGGLAFGLSDANLYLQFEGQGGGGLHVQSLAAGTIALDRWSHIAVEIYSNSGDLYFYANGVPIDSQPGLLKAASDNPEIVIGAAQVPDGNVPPNKDGTLPNKRINFFSGMLDEVVIQGWVPQDTSSAEALFAGRYNPNDSLLRPGQEVGYTSDLENALMERQISGRRSVAYPAQLTDQPSIETPLTLEPARSVSFEDNFTVKATAASGAYSLTQSLDGIINVPAKDVWKDPSSNRIYSWPALQSFAGVSRSVSDANQPVDLNNKSFTIATWLKPTNSDSQRRGILGRNSGQNNAFPYLLTVGKQLKFGFGTGSGASAVEVSANDGDSNVLNLNQWNFVAVRYDLNGSQGTPTAVTFFVNGAKLNSTVTSATPNSPDSSFLIGRASSLGKVNITNVNLICEGDGIGDGEYDLVDLGGNIWHDSGTEPKNWALNLQRTFNDFYLFTLCEDDHDTNAICEGADETMGVQLLTSDMAAFASTVTLSNPADKTVCEYDWGRARFPDIASLTYNYSSDSLPFVGDLRDIEIHAVALSDSEIANLRSHGDQVAQFRMDEIPQSTNFEDYISFHQLGCTAPACPQSGDANDPKQNTSASFDGVDDFLEEGSSVPIDDMISSDIASSNSGYAISLWIKPITPTAALHNSVINIASFDASNGTKKGTLNLLHQTTPREGFVVFYRDEETRNPFSQIGNCVFYNDGLERYGDWLHVSINMDAARQTANLYIDGIRCSTPSTPLQATYIPKRGDRFTVGRAFANPTYLPFRGNIDDLHIHRKPLTAAEIAAVYRQGTYAHWQLDEPQTPPVTTVKGVMGNGLQFNTFDNRYFVVADRADLYKFDGDIDNNPNTPNPMTFALWVQAEDIANRKRPLLSIQNRPFNINDPRHSDFLIYLDNGIPKISYYQSNSGSDQIGAANQKISENIWQHLVFRKDEAGGMSIFINGYKASNIAGNWNFSDVRSPSEGMLLGADLTDQSSFKGRIDEVAVYRSALSDQEIRELYNFQNSWVDESVTNNVRVDADAPTSNLQLKATYFPNSPQFLYIATADASSKVSHAQLGVDSGSGIVWTGATADKSDAEGNSWLPLFEPTGEGVYTLYTRATDSVGNSETSGTGQTVYVDGKAPIININAVASLLRPQPSGNEPAVWYLDLVGASFDPIIPGSEQAGSGTATIDVHLSNGNGENATLFDTQRATINAQTGEWTIRYKLNIANPTGEYQVNAVAVDNVGNQATAKPITVRIDTTAPQAHVSILTSPTYQQALAAVVASDALSATAFNADYPSWLDGNSTIGGVVSEQPDDVVAQSAVAGVAGVELAFAPLFTQGSTFRNQPLSASTLLYLPLDESRRRAGLDQSFADISPAKQGVLTCVSAICPRSGALGRSGQALEFDGIDDVLTLTNTATINKLTNDFTIAAWIKPQTVGGLQRILSTARSKSTNGFGFGIYEGGLLMTTYGVQDYLTTKVALGAGVWQHVAVHLTTNNAAEFYLNGLLVETVAGSAPAAADGDDRLLLGATTEPGETATSQHFTGSLDEVVVTRGRLTANDWETVLGSAPTLRLDFEDPFINPNRRLSNDAGLAIGDTVYLAGNLPADINLRTVGIVGAGALAVKESEGALIGAAAPGVLPDKNGAFTMAFWGDLADANAQLAFWIGRPDGTQNRIQVKPTSITLDFTGQAKLAITTPSLLARWHHLLLSYDGKNRVLYLDGVEIGRDAIAANTLNTSGVGMFVAGGTGAMDDLRVYRYALNAYEAKSLAATGWRTTTLVQAAEAQAQSTWSAGVPTGLEGFYELQSRGFDALDNVDDEARELVTWRGLVDSLAPRTRNFSSTVTATGITFAWTVEDFDLATSPLQMPAGCSSSNTTQRASLYESPWYRSFAEQSATAADATTTRNRTYQLSLECRATFAATNDTFKVCDIAGNCTEAKYTGPNVGLPPAPTRTVYLPIIARAGTVNTVESIDTPEISNGTDITQTNQLTTTEIITETTTDITTGSAADGIIYLPVVTK